MSRNTDGSNLNSNSRDGGSRNDPPRNTSFEERMSAHERQTERLSLLVAEMCALQQAGATDGDNEEKNSGAREEDVVVSRGSERSEALGPTARQTLLPVVGHTQGQRVHDDDDDQSYKEERSIGSRGGSDDLGPADVGPPRAGQYGGGGSARGLGPDGESAPQWSGSDSFNLTIPPKMPTFSGTSSFSRFEKEALLFARRCCFDSVFRPGASGVPVGDVSKSREDIIAKFSEFELNANTDACVVSFSKRLNTKKTGTWSDVSTARARAGDASANCTAASNPTERRWPSKISTTVGPCSRTKTP